MHGDVQSGCVGGFSEPGLNLIACRLIFRICRQPDHIASGAEVKSACTDGHGQQAVLLRA
jgi:hypothetical protein